MAKLPTVKLDSTLADLYRRASPRNADKRIGQVLCGTNSGMPLTEEFPRNVKYLYQDSPFNNIPKEKLTSENSELQRDLAMKYLSLVPQRDAFISGNTAVVLFNVDQTEEQIAHDKQEAESTIAILDQSQRPELVFCPGPKKIPMKENNIDMLAYKVVLDALEDYPPAVDLDSHWLINSKVALAQSGLPTPKADIIELEGYSTDAAKCCEACTSGDAYYIPSECSGSRDKWVTGQIDRILQKVSKHPLPFVLKNQQTFGGAGTYVIKTEEERKQVMQEFEDGLLRKLFSQVTAANHHLKPGSVLLSDMVREAIGDYGLTFFVTETGGAIFLAISEQMIDSNSAWIGSTINYKRQEEYEAKFSSIMNKIAAWLHKYKYFGPAGADILETAPSDDQEQPNGFGRDADANFNIVDLNVRTSGSLCLPLLRGHYESRGLNHASSFSITVKSTRNDFIEKWKDDFESGKMLIMSWYEDKSAGHSIADIAVGDEDEEQLQKVMKRIRDESEDVTF